MPISEFSQISLSQIFQELPSLVKTDGLFVEVHGFSHAASYVGDISFRVTTYTGTNGRLKESRLQRKMLGLSATPSSCTFCPPEAGHVWAKSKGAAATPQILAPDTCPLCLTVSATPGWVKETTMVNARLHHSGKIELSSHADILQRFHRRGIGRRLMGLAAAEWLQQEGKSFSVGVLTANQPARAFYEALGATFVRPDIYQWHGHALDESIYIFENLDQLARFA